jgi:FkbH-like protein
LTRRILLWAPETQVVSITDESARREDMIRKQIVREETRAAMTREEFLAGLDCRVHFLEITSTDQPEFGRALELINKTNQFNTTGKRWSHAEIVEFLRTEGMLLVFGVTDRFADYGLVGVLLLFKSTIAQFVMSCRVLGMEIELSAVAQAVSVLRSRHPDVIGAVLNSTQDNAACRDIYAKSGFASRVAADGACIWELLPESDVAIPPHIAVKSGWPGRM